LLLKNAKEQAPARTNRFYQSGYAPSLLLRVEFERMDSGERASIIFLSFTIRTTML
jgi:hypothetical protein